MAGKGKEAILTKSQFVMALKKEGKHVAHFHTDVDGEVPSAFKDSYMPHDNFIVLGRPNKITVTIEPGDKLNG